VANSTQPWPEGFRLQLDGGDLVAVDATPFVDEENQERTPAVVLRLPRWRAHSLAHVLSEWTAIANLFYDGGQTTLHEGDLARALYLGSAAAGDRDAREDTQRHTSSITTGQRAVAAAILRQRAGLDVQTMFAVVDAAAWWLDEPDGGAYCLALLQAVTNQEDTARAAYLALLGVDDERGDGSAPEQPDR